MKYPAYQKYKPSGVKWLGNVPENWEVKRLKYSATVNDEALPETTDPGYEFRYVDISGVDPVKGIASEEEMIFENAPSRARRVVRDGDTIISTVRTYLRAIAPIRNPSDSLIVSTGFAVVRPRSVEATFLSYALRESSFVETVVARSVGVSYPAVNASEVATIPIPLPPPLEQHAIANFLDAETAKLDTLLAKKRDLIEKLKEKRAALISQTVTRGLPPEAARAAGFSMSVIPGKPEGRDPESRGGGKDWIPASAGMTDGVRFKPSGIEWLGDIPEHWEVKQGRWIGKLFGSVSPSEDDFVEEGGAPFAKVDDLNNLGTDLLLSVARNRVVGFSSSMKEKFLLFPKRGAAIFTNKVAISEPGILFDSNLMGWAIDSKQDIKYVAYCLIARRLDDLADVSTVPQINNKHIYPAFFPVPALVEQHTIAQFLDAETAKIDRMVAKIEAAIERLQEYRAALITAAVTGKIDVRNSHHSGESRNPGVDEGDGYRPRI